MHHLVKIVLLVAIVIGVSASVAATKNQKPEGDSPYTPTKLEWLALRLNVEQDRGGDVQLVFQPDDDEKNTLEAQIIYPPQTDEPLLTAYENVAKRSVARISQQYGWDWVQIEVQKKEVHSGLE